MAFLTFESTNILDSNTVHFMILIIVVEFLVNAVKFIACAIAIIEIHFCFAVTVDTPSHAQFSFLFHLMHFLDISMAGLALNITNSYVLRVVEIHVVRKVVDLYPLYRRCHR
jgi:hypothetical protein